MRTKRDVRTCIIAQCGNMLSERTQFEECPQCRRMFHYWYKKRPDEVIARQNALSKWQERMVRLATTPKGRKHVKAIKQVRHAYAAAMV